MAKKRRQKKLTIFTRDQFMADTISMKLRIDQINHTRKNVDGTHVFRPTKFHQRKFEKILDWLQSVTNVEQVNFN